MKKYIILIFIASLFFTACDPTADVYDELDVEYGGPYHETGLDYIFTIADYKAASEAAVNVAVTTEDTAWAESIENYRSFNDKYTANEFAPAVLSSNFPELKEGSAMIVKYNQYIGQMYGDIASVTLTNDDYIAMGGTTADTLCFVEADNPDDYLPEFLLGEYPSATENNYVEVTYKYPDYNTKAGSFYMFDGTVWSLVEGSYVLSRNDYDSMGEDSGQPGNYNNFSDDAAPADYLPQFLRTQYPYAQADDELILVIHYYGNETSVYAVTCMYDGADWQINFPGVKTSAQFVYANDNWVFDPTVNHTMNSDDFWIIVNYIKDHSTLSVYLDEEYLNSEYYYGSSAYYANFDMRVSKRKSNDPLGLLDGMTDDEISTEIYSRLDEALIIYAETSFSAAVPVVDGIQVYYIITYDVFNDNYEHELITAKLKCIGEGQFELVEE